MQKRCNARTVFSVFSSVSLSMVDKWCIYLLLVAGVATTKSSHLPLMQTMQ